MKWFYSCRAVCISDDTFLLHYTVHILDVCCSILPQNTREEVNQLLQACRVGDLETVKRLSIQVTPRNVHSLNCRLLHCAARLVMKY